MQNKPKGKDIESLLSQYNHEIDTLKEKLLKSESWDNLVENRNRTTGLAIAMHRNSPDDNSGVADQLQSPQAGNPAEAE